MSNSFAWTEAQNTYNFIYSINFHLTFSNTDNRKSSKSLKPLDISILITNSEYQTLGREFIVHLTCKNRHMS